MDTLKDALTLLWEDGASTGAFVDLGCGDGRVVYEVRGEPRSEHPVCIRRGRLARATSCQREANEYGSSYYQTCYGLPIGRMSYG